MKNKILIYISVYILGFMLLSVIPANADEVVVIVNASNSEDISVAEIKKLYENHTLNWSNGSKVVLYDLPVKDEARKKFSNAVLGKDAGKVAMEWASKKITNTAKNPPRTLKSAVLVQSKVGKDPNAIGYLFKSKVTNKDVRIVATLK